MEIVFSLLLIQVGQLSVTVKSLNTLSTGKLLWEASLEEYV